MSDRLDQLEQVRRDAFVADVADLTDDQQVFLAALLSVHNWTVETVPLDKLDGFHALVDRTLAKNTGANR